MTDRELLEAAAKAAGVELIGVNDPDLWTRDGRRLRRWNPLEDSADAFRVAVRLQLSITHTGEPNCVSVAAPNAAITDACQEPHGRNRPAAVRRAIVRAASMLPPRQAPA